MKHIKHLRTFIVDDIEQARIYKQHLVLNGFTQVTCIHDFNECLKQLVQQPAIVFLNFHMHNTLNSIDTLKKISEFNPNIHIVPISSKANLGQAVASLKAGSFDYIEEGEKALDMMNAVLRRIINIEIAAHISPINKWYSMGLSNMLN